MNKSNRKQRIIKGIIKIAAAIVCVLVSFAIDVIIAFWGNGMNLNRIIVFLSYFVMPLLFLPIFFKSKRKVLLIISISYTIVVITMILVNVTKIQYDKSLRINTDVNIDVNEYLPFNDDSKIVKLEREASLKFSTNDDLPKVDGAAATFPVYSAFVNAVYPSNITLNTSVFLYTNTINGYNSLANKNIDIFFGAYPSQQQIEYAEALGTEFEYTKIGKEGFVFFVNKNNPVDSLTEEEIKGIYSGRITNWKEVGGKNEKIVAFQRNEGSGSQSMLKRFMNGTKIMEAPKDKYNDLMMGIVNQVADYTNYSNSIGFSFRYYLEGIAKNKEVKMLKINGISPTKENITNDKYIITTPLYAVTYKGNENKNVEKFLKWILSDEGQSIVDKTGYARIK